MELPNEKCNTLFICGNLTKVTEKFNEQTRIKQVYDYLRQSFCENLPESYQIVYYDTTKMSFVNLENQLRNESNPFQVNLSDGVRSTTSTTDCIRLYVVSNTNSQSGSEDDQRVSTTTDDENSLLTNDDVSQNSLIATDDRLSTIIPQSIDLQETSNSSSKRLTFLLDVKSTQRDIYKSDQFSVRTGESNGRIARIQGVKRDDQKMLQILPKLLIPSINFNSKVTLLVAVVFEELKNGMRIWYRHPDKGFLPERYEKDTQTINPIVFDLNTTNVKSNGEFILSLQMITKWAKIQRDHEEIYRFDDRKTRELHSAEHDSTSPRLICVLQRNDKPDWDTFCLSNFIRTPKAAKQRSASAVSTEMSHSPVRKRARRKY